MGNTEALSSHFQVLGYQELFLITFGCVRIHLKVFDLRGDKMVTISGGQATPLPTMAQEMID